tara:strand:- start:39851 stop:42250 length:2400 start_codon:yes stop_codon:yes gene_type:complete
MAVEKVDGVENIDAPEGVTSVEIEEAELAPNVTEMDDGSVVIGEIEEQIAPIQVPFNANLAEFIDDTELGRISSDLVGEVQEDINSRKEWEDQYKSGLELLGMNYEDRAEPFEGASGIVHPLLAESVTQFQAQAYRELLPAGGPVKTAIIGQETPEVTAQAERVKNFMNYQITYEMEEYDPELDQMLFYLPIVGSSFKKVYFDPSLQRAVSKFVHAEDLIVPYNATDLKTSTRICHVIRMDSNEIRKLQLSGFYKDIELPTSDSDGANYDEVRETIKDIEGIHSESSYNEELTLYEIHTDLDLPGFEDQNQMGENTGLKMPYIVTIVEKSGEVLSIKRNFNEADPLRSKIPYFVHYKFLPGLGFYGFGLTHMIGGLSRASTSILRQLIDAGTLSNLPAGFKARGARIRDDETPLNPGEFRDVDMVGMDLRQAIMPLPFKEPSQTLYSLLGTLIDSGRRFASMADMKVGDMQGNSPVGTTMAIMERGTKVMSAIHKRLHYSQKIEFKILARIFAMGAPIYPYQVPGAPPEIKQSDFDQRIDVLPVSDPNIFSMSQRIALAQTQLQLAQSNPEIHGQNGMYQAYRKMYEALGVSNIDAVLQPPPQPMPMNPAKENQEALRGARLQAFPEQNHQAHISAHLAMIATPIAQSNASIVMTLQGHISEHIAMMSEIQAQQEITANMTPEQQAMMQSDPNAMQQFQTQVASRAAEISSEVSEQYAQSITPPPSEDPLVSIRKQELALKGQELAQRQEQFDVKQKFAQDKERNDVLLDQQRLDQQEEIANQNDQTKRDIAAAKEMKG